MVTEEFFLIRDLIIRYLKRNYDVYDRASVILGVSFVDKQGWKIDALFDQLASGSANGIPYCDAFPLIEKSGPLFLSGSGITIDLALSQLKRRVNKLLRFKP